MVGHVLRELSLAGSRTVGVPGAAKHHVALERERRQGPLASAPSRRSGVAHSAARRTGQQPARGPLGLQQRAQREQVVGQRLEPASRARSPSSKRLSAHASSLPWGARRETRLQKARSSSSCSAVTISIPCGRPPAPSASGFHAPPPTRRPRERTERHAAVAEQTQRAQQILEDLAAAGDRLAGVVLAGGRARRSGARRRPSSAPSSAPSGSPSRTSGWAIVRPLVSASSRRADREAVQRGQKRRLRRRRRAPSAPAARAPRAGARGAARSRSVRRTRRAAARRIAARTPRASIAARRSRRRRSPGSGRGRRSARAARAACA